MNAQELINTARMLATGDKGLAGDGNEMSMTTGILQLMKPVSYRRKEINYYGTQYRSAQGSRIEAGI
jgi:hypothetical protein